MHQQIFVNLPVKDLERSKAFFGRLGYAFNPQFTNEQAACMVLGENLYAMLLVESFFQTFTHKPVHDARKATEVLTCLSCSSRQEVDDLVAKAVAAGARPADNKQDYGFMYGHGFEDLDGHGWELMWMDPNAAPPHA